MHMDAMPQSGKRGRPRKAGRSGDTSFVRYPKGLRPVDEKEQQDIERLLGRREDTRPDLLIEYLHVIQDEYGHIGTKHLSALAHHMSIPLAQAYEVATFYAHFDVIDENAGETPPPPLTIRVCDSLSCEMAGAKTLLEELKKGSDPTKIRIVTAPCMGRCDTAPIAVVGQRHCDQASARQLLDWAKSGKTQPTIPDYQDFDAYVAKGGYATLRSCVTGKRKVEDVIQVIEDAGLRGMGGAGFPTGTKWKFVRREAKPRLMTLNADEGEPGTFKDRYFMEKDPHRVLEGMLIGAWVVEATDVYFYLRDEYPASYRIIERELKKLAALQLSLPKIHLRRGAGAYICGEESAMIESIEGKRGMPRHKPPYISSLGLFGRPTLNNNVESVYWVRDILEKGTEWFVSQGTHDCKGPHSFSVSGRVRDPGVKIAPAGITMAELLEEYCGGMEEGHKFKAYLPGGASGGILPASLADIPLDFGKLESYGCFIGSGAIIVLSDKDQIRDVVLNLMRFFEDESCGQCTPCRVGTQKAVRLLEKPDWDRGLLVELKDVMTDASICGLGQAAGNPIACALKFFPDDAK